MPSHSFRKSKEGMRSEEKFHRKGLNLGGLIFVRLNKGTSGRTPQNQVDTMRAEVLGVVLAVCFQAWGQGPAQSRASLSAPAGTQDIGAPVAGGKLHGAVKSGNIPLPGVTVTAQNTLTGKRYATTTDIGGAWQLNVPQDGSYVIRTQFAAFAGESQQAVLSATSRDRLVNFDLVLASRQTAHERQQARQEIRDSRRVGAGGENVQRMA